MSFKEDLTAVNTLYHNSISRAELKDGLKSLDKLLSSGLLNAENTGNAEALFCRIYIKYRLLAYFENFGGDILGELEEYIASQNPVAQKKGYKKTCAVMTAASALLKVCKKTTAEVGDCERAMEEGASASVCTAVAERLEKLIADIRCAGLASPFGEGVVFPDVEQCVLSRLNRAKARAEEICFKELEERAGKIFKKISDKYRLYEYFPLPDYDEGGLANTVIICSPFAEEAKLYATCSAGNGAELYELDATVFEGYPSEFIARAFEYAQKKCGGLVVSFAESLQKSKRDELYRRAMLAGKGGLKIFIHDENGDGKEYESCLAITAGSQNLGAVDVSVNYLTMPSFADVCAELEQKGIISGASEYEILKQMPFLGFLGLNKIVSEFIAGGDWVAIGKKISHRNLDSAKRYISTLKSEFQFIDSGWGDFSSLIKCVETTDKGFDYDGVREIDLENVRRIVESGHTVFAKCGMIARYCTLGGADKTEWDKVAREEMTERIALATKLVFKLLKIDIVPEVEVLDELKSNPTAGGLCCDGGKRILYKYADCKNWTWLAGCIVHESFHAMQAKLRKGGWSQWYYDNLGITRGRVERWSFTNNIYDQNTNSDLYKVHIVEADAKAFELDCDDGRNFAWNTIEFV